MSNFLLDLSFGVKRSDGYVSDIWHASTTRLGDFHLATGSIAGVEKYSFNKSGMCRSAHTGADGAPAALRDRAGFRWRRAATPPRGSGRASRVAWIAFPTDYLSRPTVEDDGEILWIDAAPACGATYVEFAIAAEPERGIRGVLDIMQDRTLVRCASTRRNPGHLLLLRGLGEQGPARAGARRGRRRVVFCRRSAGRRAAPAASPRTVAEGWRGGAAARDGRSRDYELIAPHN